MKMGKVSIGTAIIYDSAAGGGATITTIDIPIDKDCGGNQNSGGTNSNGGSLYAGCVSGWQNYGLFHANFSSIPSNATIVSAKLMLYRFVGYAPNDAYYSPFTTHRVTVDWTETGPTWNSKPAMTAAYNFHISGNPGTWNAHELTQMVQEWISGIYPNYGAAMMPPSTMGKEACNYSRNHTDAALRPYIRVKYAII